jgi:hypothetical protein
VKRTALAIVLLLAGCSSPATTSPPPPSTVETTTTSSTTTAVELINACDPPTFFPTVLPATVSATQPSTSQIQLDQFTTLPGTTIRVWSGDSGQPVMVMIRGTLPPEKWTAAPEHVTVRGIDAALGPLQDGVWAAAWYEGPDSCDEYSLIFYPPVDTDEARAVAESMTGGS